MLAPALLFGATLLGAGLPTDATAGPEPASKGTSKDLEVAKKARAEGLVHDDAPAESELEAVIDKAMWFPEYPRYKAGK